MSLDFCLDLHRNLLQDASALLLDHKNLSKTIDLTLFLGGCLALSSLRGAKNDTSCQSYGYKLSLRLCSRSKMQTASCFSSGFKLFCSKYKIPSQQ